MQADSTLSRVNVLQDKIEATEALLTIQLDSRRNDLVAFDLVRYLHPSGPCIDFMRQDSRGRELQPCYN